jgi:hypothetical protein
MSFQFFFMSFHVISSHFTSFHVISRHFKYMCYLNLNFLWISFFLSFSFQAFRPSPSSPLSHSSSSSQFPYLWVPSKIEAQEAVPVPFQPTVDTQLSNEIEFHKSNELLVPGKQKSVNRAPSFAMGFGFLGFFCTL